MVAFAPSPGTPGEGWDEGSRSTRSSTKTASRVNLHPSTTCTSARQDKPESRGFEPRFSGPKPDVLPIRRQLNREAAEGDGFEPPFPRPERGVLPLDDPSKVCAHRPQVRHNRKVVATNASSWSNPASSSGLSHLSKNHPERTPGRRSSGVNAQQIRSGAAVAPVAGSAAVGSQTAYKSPSAFIR